MTARWVPIAKAFASELPHRENRPFTKLEAMFSLMVDYDSGSSVTVRGYAGLWRWSEGKVRRFLEEVGVSIQYPDDTTNRQNQRGVIVIVITERKRSDNGEIIAIDSKWLASDAERKRSEDGVKTERSQTPTKNPYPKPIKTSSPGKTPKGFSLFNRWFCYAYENIQREKYIFEGGKDGKHIRDMLKMVPEVSNLVIKACHFLLDKNRFPASKAPTLSFLRSKLNDYSTGATEAELQHFRDVGILPPEGSRLEQWQPWTAEGAAA